MRDVVPSANVPVVPERRGPDALPFFAQDPDEPLVRGGMADEDLKNGPSGMDWNSSSKRRFLVLSSSSSSTSSRGRPVVSVIAVAVVSNSSRALAFFRSEGLRRRACHAEYAIEQAGAQRPA